MKKLDLKIGEKNYDLRLNRNSIKWLEARGFVLDDLDKKIVTYRDLLWASLFVANYVNTNVSEIETLREEYIKEKGVNMFNKVVAFAMDEYLAFLNAQFDTNSKMKDEELVITEI